LAEDLFRKRNRFSFKVPCLIILAILFFPAIAPRVYAFAHSSKVAYVTDFGSMSVCATNGIDSSIFVNAITDAPPAGCPNVPTYTTTGGNTVTFTDVTVAAIDAGGLAAIAGFDTVLLYEVCDIANHTATMAALNSYLTAGDGKLVIYDADRCYGPTIPNYGTFLFPFTTSNPGPEGYAGTPTFIETETQPAVLTRALAGILTGNSTDAIGDSNTFVANNPAWCAAEEGPNGLGVVGIQIGYARTAAGGLVIYDGNDNWSTYGHAWDAQVFSNILDQPFNPDGLPCGRVATGITVTPGTATDPVGSSHTVTATLLNSSGAPLVGVTVTFKVTSGPNAGKTGTCVTNAAGQCTFTYSDPPGVTGTDNIVATFTDATGTLHSSNTATKTWQPVCTNTTVTVSVTHFVTQPPCNGPGCSSQSTVTTTVTVSGFVTQPPPCNGPTCSSQATVTGAIMVLGLVGVFLVLFVVILMIIRRKVRCRNCGQLFDERLRRCPRCGAPA